MKRAEALRWGSHCEGHPAGPFDPMGQTVYCDGSCRPKPRFNPTFYGPNVLAVELLAHVPGKGWVRKMVRSQRQLDQAIAKFEDQGSSDIRSQEVEWSR